MNVKGLMEKWIEDVKSFGKHQMFLERTFAIIRYQAYQNQIPQEIIKELNKKMCEATSSMDYCPLALGSRR